MCYTTVVSITSARDLSEFNTALVQFSRTIPKVPEEAFLRYRYKWHLGSRDGCSCGLRHLDLKNANMGFAMPVSWWPEAQEDIEATLQAVNAFKIILRDGSKLDCIDSWEQVPACEPKLHGEVAVDLSTLADESFRFLEGYRLEFTYET